MPRAALTLSLWALVQAAPGAGGFAQAPPAVPSVVSEVLIQGGSESDRSFARRALGVQPGQGLSADALEAALAAVRATDRFRVVKGTLLPGAGGAQLKLELEAWPLLQAVSFRGDRPPSYRDQLFPEVRKRTTPGDFRIRRWVDFAQQKLRESGYPQAQVRISREAGDTRLVAEVKTGPAALVHTCTRWPASVRAARSGPRIC